MRISGGIYMTGISKFSNDELIRSLRGLVFANRANAASLVEHLVEIDARRLHLELGYSSLFVYCMLELGFSDDEAFRRIAAVRIVRKFPQALAALTDGSVTITSLALLRPHLTSVNGTDLLELIRGVTVAVAKERIAARFPQADIPPAIRKQRRRGASQAAATNASSTVAAAASAQDQDQDHLASPPGVASEVQPPAARPLIAPLSLDRFALKLTISRAIKENLDLARDLMRHRSPSGDLEVIIGQAIELLVERLCAEKLGRVRQPRKQRPRAKSQGSVGSQRTSHRRPVTAAVRREVVQREGLGCDFVGRDGHRCGAVAFLEFDHETPVALGGGPEAPNIRQRCWAHNQLEAENAFGRPFMERVRAQKSTAAARAPPPPLPEGVGVHPR